MSDRGVKSPSGPQIPYQAYLKYKAMDPNLIYDEQLFPYVRVSEMRLVTIPVRHSACKNISAPIHVGVRI